MTISDYPASIERARLALGPVKERLRAVRGQINGIRGEAKLRNTEARDDRGRRLYRVEVARRAAISRAVAEDPKFIALSAEVEALDRVREECQARLERLRHEFELAVTARGNGSIQQGVAN